MLKYILSGSKKKNDESILYNFFFLPFTMQMNNTHLQKLVVPSVRGASICATTVEEVSRHGGTLQGGGLFADGRVSGYVGGAIVQAENQQTVLDRFQAQSVSFF